MVQLFHVAMHPKKLPVSGPVGVIGKSYHIKCSARIYVDNLHKIHADKCTILSKMML